jgi:glucose-1-phosphatase
LERRAIFHLVPAEEWARGDDPYRPASLEAEGFVHCSAREQIPRVAASVFAHRPDLVLLEIDPEQLPSEVIWEDLYDLGEDFPHVYGPIPRTAVVRVSSFDDDRPNQQPRLVICDLGGVVIQIDHHRILAAWAARSRLPASEVHAGFPDPAYHAFERGELTESAYLEHVRQRCSLDGTDEELTEGLNRIFLGPDSDTVEVLRGLRADGCTVVALSNTNPIHERAWSTRYADHLEVFDAIHCSHHLGVRKPDPDAYIRVLEHHRTAPEDALFIDDLEVNVEAARALGLTGIVFEGAARLAASVTSWSQPTRHGRGCPEASSDASGS